MPFSELDPQITSFSELASADHGNAGLLPSHWGRAEWAQLFEYADLRSVPSGQALIRRGDTERTLYFVLEGSLEVIVHSGHGISLGALSKAAAGMVLGEVSFFDGQPRSVSVWALQDSQVAAVTWSQFTEFESRHPKLARDLLFALGRVLAARLRSTNAQLKVDG